MENIKWNENEKSIYYKDIETKIIKSIDLINKEIFQIQEHIIDYEQFGEKDINKLKEFSRNYPFQISFDEFGISNYWGCEGDEEYLNKMPIKNEERKEEKKKFKVTLNSDESYSIIINAVNELEANKMAPEKFNNQNPPYIDFKIEDGQGFDIIDTEEIKE